MSTGGEETQVTALLQRWNAGDDDAREALVEQVYHQLKQIARRQLAGERAGHTLQPTALVNEAYLKLSTGENVDWKDRVHFFAVAARVIRQILIDHGRKQQAARRKGQAVTLHTQIDGGDEDLVDLLALDQALDQLEGMDAEQARIVELRYFAGLTIAETALATGMSTATVERYWRAARAWLYMTLGSAT